MKEEDRERESIGFRRRREKRRRAQAFLAGHPLFAGLDLAKQRHAVWLAGPDLTPIRRFMVDHSLEGVQRFLREAERARVGGGFDRTIVFMEPTSHFWENVARILEAHEIPYRLVSTLAVDRQREIEHITYAKGDYRDAELIVQLGARGQWLRRRAERVTVWRQLRALAGEHEVLLAAESPESVRIRSLLELAVPEFLDYFRDPVRKTAEALLRKLTRPIAEVPATYAALRERLTQLHVPRLRRGKLSALAARLAAAPSFGVEDALAPSLVRVGLALDRFRLIADQRADVRAQLVELYRATPYHKALDTVPGVGPESQALLLGFIGDPKQYDRSTCLVKLAGSEPRENESGTREGSHSISRRGISALRHVVYRVVLGLRNANAEFAGYLAHLRQRENNPLTWHAAAVATGNKYLRLFHRLCVSGEPYNPAKLRTRL